MVSERLTYAVIFGLVLVSGAVFVAPSGGVSSLGQTFSAASTQNATTTATPTATPTETAIPTPTLSPSTDTAKPTDTATATRTEVSTATTTADEAVNLSNVTTVFEIEKGGDRVMISLQNTDQLNTSGVDSIRVEGMSVRDSLSLNEPYPSALGVVERPATVEVIVTFSDGREAVLASRDVESVTND
ncbi:hypothetical protein [Salinigranum halophilum]|uniref:hypothetical protein n=1 Tax=Salinigranum halophilum TaxID=2565931 RepID=UPI0010A790C4|nr:hypothetical protein [Salinigranum halophilum]